MQEAPFLLFINTIEGMRVDLNAFSRSSIELCDLVKEIAYVLDPSASVNIEIFDAKDGSLDLKSFIKIFAKDSKFENLTLRAILIAVLVQLFLFGIETAKEIVIDKIKPDAHITQEDINKIAERVSQLNKNNIVRDKSARFHQELIHDPNVTGVGAADSFDKSRMMYVDRSEMQRMSTTVLEDHGNKRTRREDTTVVLLRPYLEPGNHRWRFRNHEGNFSAAIGDTEFLDKVISGSLGIRLMAGVTLRISLETKEEKRGDVWVPVERSVERVYRWGAPPTQESFGIDPAPSQDMEPEADDDEDD
jgi:hypothetical protein